MDINEYRDTITKQKSTAMGLITLCYTLCQYRSQTIYARSTGMNNRLLFITKIQHGNFIKDSQKILNLYNKD